MNTVLAHKFEMSDRALAIRSDEIRAMGAASDYLGGEDDREVVAFFVYEGCDLYGSDPDEGSFPGYSRRLIGVTLDFDEVLTRSESQDRLGHGMIEVWEGAPWSA